MKLKTHCVVIKRNVIYTCQIIEDMIIVDFTFIFNISTSKHCMTQDSNLFSFENFRY